MSEASLGVPPLCLTSPGMGQGRPNHPSALPALPPARPPQGTSPAKSGEDTGHGCRGGADGGTAVHLLSPQGGQTPGHPSRRHTIAEDVEEVRGTGSERLHVDEICVSPLLVCEMLVFGALVWSARWDTWNKTALNRMLASPLARARQLASTYKAARPAAKEQGSQTSLTPVVDSNCSSGIYGPSSDERLPMADKL
jgi:hypothetical protein